MRLIITFLMAWCLSLGACAATAPDAKQLTQELEQAKAAKPAQPETVEALQSALNALEERKGSLERAQQYQQVIDNFPKLSATLRAQLSNLRDEPRNVPTGLSTDALNQEILQVSSQLLEKSRQAQQEQDRAREIADSLSQLPQQQTDARRQLNELERRIGTANGNSAQNQAMQAESAKLKALVDELELAQLSANNRQELARMRSNWRKNRVNNSTLTCRLCAINSTVSVNVKQSERWKAPNCWRKTARDCRKVLSISSRLTASCLRP